MKKTLTALAATAVLTLAVAATAPGTAQAAARSMYAGAASTTSEPTWWPMSMHNGNDGQCLSVAAGSTAGAAHIIQWGCYGGPEQQWEFINPMTGPDDNSYYEIQSTHDNDSQCLAVPAGSHALNVQLIQYGCYGGSEQYWEPVDVNGAIALKNLNSGLCAAVGGGSNTPGAPVSQWTCDNGPEQAWDIYWT